MFQSSQRHKWIRLVSALALVSLSLAAPGVKVHAAAPPPPLAPAACDPDKLQASGAIYRICMPGPFPAWNYDLIVFAHGYMAPNQPVRIPEEQLHLPDGTYIPTAINLLGYAFATTSYYTNGLAVREGLADLVDLVSIFKGEHPTVNHVYLVGASEGGLITTLAVEQYPQVFSGGLATCGPIGDFAAHANYLGDFRAVFDYFFPGLMPGTPITIPQSLIDTWETSYYSTTVLPVLMNPAGAISITQLLSVTMSDAGFITSTTAISTVSGLLWYSVFATNDAKAKLGGQPFDNWTRVYTGSLDDATLNATVQRFSADQAALDAIEAHYQTSGVPLVPLVTIHTTLDPIVPYWHETLYRSKVELHGMTPRHDNIPVARYGHCSFETNEVIQALTLLQQRVANPPPFLGYLPVILKQ
jgi:pimeloyl-ACP methyl ester carboxylesterase